MYYLAGPYTYKHEDKKRQQWIHELRYTVLSQIACNMMDNDELVFSPITHGHAIEKEAGRVVDYHKWIAHGLIMLQMCEIVFVAQLPGWRESSGVQIEMSIAKANNIPIQYIEYDRIKIMLSDSDALKILEQELERDKNGK